MQPAIQFALKSWSLPLPLTLVLLLSALFYLRGWLQLRRTFPRLVPIWRAVAFLCGLISVWIAVGSPVATLDMLLLSAHMAQHLLLMTLGAPLILLGAPQLVLPQALPQLLMRGVLGPFSRSAALRRRGLQRLGRVITEPVFCWLAATTVLIAWHVPAIYALALESHRWHQMEHASFLAAGLLFWWPVIPRWPGDTRNFRWSIVLYLFLATLPCDALSAFLAFCDRVVYTSYLEMPTRFNLSPLQDQQFAGALMWVCVTFAYLVPAVILTMVLLSTPRAGERSRYAPMADALRDDRPV
jgi:cytochrome c oxidase assembly factor CtaG